MPNSSETNASIKLVEAAAWKAASNEERSSLGLIKSHACDPEVVKAQPDQPDTERALDWVVSTEDVDRDRDILRVAGWDLKAFKKNPVVLWAHNYSAPPIGKAVDIQVDRDKLQLRMRKQFAPKEISPFADMIFQLAKEKYLRTASVGFIAKDWEENTDQEADRFGRRGFVVKKQELLESSVVPVPSNPMALSGAKSVHGIDLAPYVEWAEQILDGEKGAGLWIPRKSVEDIIAVVRPAKPTVIVPAALEPETKGNNGADAVTPPADPTPPVPVPASADGAPAPEAGVKEPSDPGPVSTPAPIPTLTETAAALVKQLEAAMRMVADGAALAQKTMIEIERIEPALRAAAGIPDDSDVFEVEDEPETYELADDGARAAEPDNPGDLFEVDLALLRGVVREVIGAR